MEARTRKSITEARTTLSIFFFAIPFQTELRFGWLMSVVMASEYSALLYTRR